MIENIINGIVKDYSLRTNNITTTIKSILRKLLRIGHGGIPKRNENMPRHHGFVANMD
jgi:hypothetical protein